MRCVDRPYRSQETDAKSLTAGLAPPKGTHKPAAQWVAFPLAVLFYRPARSKVVENEG